MMRMNHDATVQTMLITRLHDQHFDIVRRARETVQANGVLSHLTRPQALVPELNLIRTT